MEKKTQSKPISVALGTTFAVTLAAAPLAQAAGNPFAAVEFATGYMVADSHGAEGKCGGAKSEEGKCGGAKSEEGKCGEAAGTAGTGEEAKSMEGKCGEGKCGAAD